MKENNPILAKILREILEVSPTYHASVRAFCCLRDLAKDNDFEAIRALAITVSTKLAYETEISEYAKPKNIEEFITTENIHPLIRLYAMAFIPACFIKNLRLANYFKKVDQVSYNISRFHQLLRQHSPIENEVFKLYVLACFIVNCYDFTKDDFVRFQPEVIPNILFRIETECEVIEGYSIDSRLKFGREGLLQVPNAKTLLGIIYHEFSHIFNEEVFWPRYSPPRKLEIPKFKPYGLHKTLSEIHSDQENDLAEILYLLSDLKRAAIARQPEPSGFNKLSFAEITRGLRIIYTITESNEGFKNTISLSDPAGSIEPNQGLFFAYHM